VELDVDQLVDVILLGKAVEIALAVLKGA